MFSPDTERESKEKEHFWLIYRDDVSKNCRLFVSERYLANQLYHFNPESLANRFRISRTLTPLVEPPTEDRIIITTNFSHAIYDIRVIQQIHARAVATLVKCSLETVEFGGFKFFPGLNFLQDIEFLATPNTDGTKDFFLKLAFHRKMDSSSCSALDYHIKVLFMSMTLYEEVTLGIATDPEPCKVTYNQKEMAVDSVQSLSALLTRLINFEKYNKRGTPLMIENTTAAVAGSFGNSYQRYIVAADFRLSRTGSLPLMILKLYEFLSMGIIHRSHEISVILGQYIPVRHFIQFILLAPAKHDHFSLNFSVALPEAQLGLTKALCLRTVIEVLLRGLDATEIKLSIGQMDEFPKLSVSFFNLRAPVDPKKFRYNSQIYIPKPVAPVKQAGKQSEANKPSRKELLKIAQDERRRRQKEEQRTKLADAALKKATIREVTNLQEPALVEEPGKTQIPSSETANVSKVEADNILAPCELETASITVVRPSTAIVNCVEKGSDVPTRSKEVAATKNEMDDIPILKVEAKSKSFLMADIPMKTTIVSEVTTSCPDHAIGSSHERPASGSREAVVGVQRLDQNRILSQQNIRIRPKPPHYFK